MITCQKCLTTLSDDALFCSGCGTPTPERRPRKPDAPKDVESLLAAGNLHRIRSEWDTAMDLCIDVLRQEPDNASAHALLGDIYAAQDRLDEAVRWYEMALDLEPTSRVYTQQLDKFKRALAESNAKSEISSSQLGWFDKFVIGRSFESSVRIITVASAVFGAMLIAAALIVIFSHKQPDASGGERNRPKTAYAGNDRKSMIVDSEGGQVDTQRTEYELDMWKQINENQMIQSHRIAVDDVQVDPRSKALIVTFRNRSDSANRNEALLNAGAVAAAGFTVNEDIALVTARCIGLLTDETGHDHMRLVMVADISREAAGILQPNATSNQVDAVMSDKWWNPLAK